MVLAVWVACAAVICIVVGPPGCRTSRLTAHPRQVWQKHGMLSVSGLSHVHERAHLQWNKATLPLLAQCWDPQSNPVLRNIWQ